MSFNCQHEQEDISLLVCGLLPETERAKAEAHLKTCAGCHQYYLELSQLGMAGLKTPVEGASSGEELRTRWTKQILKKPPTPAENRWVPVRGWAFGALGAFACAVIILLVIHPADKVSPADSASLLQNPRFVRETLAMFPNRVRAICQDEHGLNLILDDNPGVPVSPPFYIHVCDGHHCSSFVTFSGQEIQLDGEKISVLADARGKMILMGNNFLWSDKDKILPDSHWKVEGLNLETGPMKG